MYFSIYTYEPDAEGRTVKFSHDKYLFEAGSWEEAEEKVKAMHLPYPHEFIGALPEEDEYIPDDEILDIMIDNNLIEKTINT